MKKGTKFLLGTAATATAVSFGAGYFLFNEVMNRNANLFKKVADNVGEDMVHAPKKEDDPRRLWFLEQKPIQFEMINPDNYRLRARMIPADEPSKKYVFCSHGYRSTGNGEYDLMSKFYHDQGFNVFIVDHRSHGESDGKYIGFGYYEYQDSLQWLDYIIEKFGDDIEIVLQGISMGCATVMMMTGAPSLPSNVKFTVADCGYTSCNDEFEYILKNILHLPNFPLLNTANFFNKTINGYDFKQVNPIDCVARAKIPMLFIHGDDDDFVPTYMVHQLYAACSSDYKDLLLVKGAGHAESYRLDSEDYESKVKEFCDKFLTK